VRAAVGDATFELLIAYLAFIRTAHYWTETHPQLEYETDVRALLAGNAELAALLLDTSEAELIEGGLKLREALQSLGRARAELRESEHQFRSFVSAASDILYKMSADWSEMQLLHGKGFLIDTSSPRLSWLDVYIPDSDKSLVQSTIADAIRTKSMFQLEHRVIRADGTIGWTFSRALPFLDERGEIAEWLGAASDITERKRAEEALRASEEHLREADRRKDEFLAMLAHELRNPLAPMRTGLELIRVAGNTPAAVERVRSMMDRQIGHMVRLIDDLLDVSRITSGKIQPARANVSQQRRKQRDRRQPRSDDGKEHRAERRAARIALCAGRRRDAVCSGPLQPPAQRHQVHRKWRHDSCCWSRQRCRVESAR
jgi:signal transduction histidine kinase